MKLVILGGGGNIGFWIEKIFLEAGHTVVSVKRGTHRSARSHAVHIEKLEVKYFDINSQACNIRELILADADIIVDCVCYKMEQAVLRGEQLGGFKGIYIFISSVAVYDRNDGLNIISPETSCNDIKWGYASSKHASEIYLSRTLKKANVIILRAGHTYDTVLPVPFGPSNWTIPHSLLKGYPLLVHRNGASHWPLLHASDFARRILVLCGQVGDFGSIVNIVSNSATNWMDICMSFFAALDVSPRVAFLSPERLALMYPYWSDSVLYHKRFDEEYVGIDQEIFSDISHGDTKLEVGMAMSIDWYLTDVRRQLFSSDDMESLSLLIDASININFDFYLLRQGY